MKWNKSTRLEKGGHRVFQSLVQPDKWAIADNSGVYPEDTDDGVLWLDFERPLRVAVDAKVLMASIPVTKRGELYSTPAGLDAIATLASMFPSWRIVASKGTVRLVSALAGRVEVDNG